MTIQAASGFIFSGKDSDLMLSLPVSAFSVMLSRITALYIENLLFIGVFMVTSGVAAITQGAGGAGFMAALLVCTLLLTFLTTLITTVIAFAVSWLTAHFPGQKLLGTLLYFAVFILIMVGAFQLNNVGTLLLQNQEAFDNLLSSWLLPFGLMKRGLAGDIAAVLLLAALSVLPFLAIVWLFSSQYKKVLSALSARTVRNDYKLGELKASGQFMTLFRREVKRYFGTSIYFFNTGFGAVTLVVAAAFACFGYRAAIPYVEAFAPLVGRDGDGLRPGGAGHRLLLDHHLHHLRLHQPGGQNLLDSERGPGQPEDLLLLQDRGQPAGGLAVGAPLHGAAGGCLRGGPGDPCGVGVCPAGPGAADGALRPCRQPFIPQDGRPERHDRRQAVGLGFNRRAGRLGDPGSGGRRVVSSSAGLMPVAGYMAVWGVLFLVLSAAVWGWLLKGGSKRPPGSWIDAGFYAGAFTA